jgi:RHS repeat-associated protein
MSSPFNSPNRVGIRNSSDYSPFGVELDGRMVSVDGYRFGFQNQEKDDEVKGEGNSINYTFRMHDPRLGRFLSVDPLAAQFAWNSPYTFSEDRVLDAVELEGKEAKLIITDEVIGYTPQRVYGQTGNMENSGYIVVPVYRMKLVDENTGKVMGTYGVTRDAWYSRGEDNAGNTLLVNREFEPKDGDKNLYTGVPLNYPNDELQALTLEQAGKGCVPAESQTKEMNTYIDGTPIDDARTDLSVACGVMVHIGGWYDNGYGEKLAGSYGCFGVIEPDQIYSKQSHAQSMIDNNAVGKHGTTNDYYKKFINRVVETLNNTKGEKKYLITVEKRTNVDKKETITY